MRTIPDLYNTIFDSGRTKLQQRPHGPEILERSGELQTGEIS